MERLSIKRNMLYHSAGSLFYLGCQWLISVLAVRLGSYETGGMFSLAVQLTNFFYVIATFSMRVFQASDTQGRFTASRYVSTRVMTASVAFTLCCLFSFGSVQYSAVQQWSIVLYMGFKLSEAMVDALAAEQQKAWRMDYCGVSFLLRGIVSLAAFIIGMSLWHSLPIALLLMAVCTMPVVILYDGSIVRRMTGLHLRLSFRECAPLLKDAWPMMFNGAMMTLLAAIPRYFLEMYAGAETLGIYASIATPAVVIQAGCSFIYSPLVSPLSELYARGDTVGFRKTLFRALGGVLLVALAAVLGAAVLGRWGLRLLFGESILPYAGLLIPALLAALCSALVYFFEVPLTIMRRLHGMMVIHLCAVMLSAALSMLMIPSMGMRGVNLTMYLATGGDAVAMGIFSVLAARTKSRRKRA